MSNIKVTNEIEVTNENIMGNTKEYNKDDPELKICLSGLPLAMERGMMHIMNDIAYRNGYIDYDMYIYAKGRINKFKI